MKNTEEMKMNCYDYNDGNGIVLEPDKLKVNMGR